MRAVASAAPRIRCSVGALRRARVDAGDDGQRVLNLGLNDRSTAGLAARTGDARIAWDCYRRLVQMFGNVVRGIAGERFEDEIARVKRERELTLDRPCPRPALLARGDNESRSRNDRSRKRSGGEAKPRRVESGGVERGKDDAVDGQGREVVARMLLELGWRVRRSESRALEWDRSLAGGMIRLRDLVGGTVDPAEVRSLPMSTVSHAQLTPLRFLERSAEVYPEKVAIVHGDRRTTYRDFASEATRLARALQALGIDAGDRVAYLCPNIPELLIAHFAVPLASGSGAGGHQLALGGRGGALHLRPLRRQAAGG
jgi:AMP-binding enzyme